MCTGKIKEDIENRLEAIINESGSFSKGECQILLVRILALTEKEKQEAFMEGYQYAITLLQEGIVNKSVH